jgi:hypothetical protein
MFGLNAVHYGHVGHVIGSAHAAAVLVEEKKDGAEGS